MKQLKILAAAVALTASAAVPAQAIDWSFNACGGSHFATCMSGNIAWDGASQIVLTITNLDSQANFKSIGLVNLGGGVTYQSFTKSTPPTGTWGLTNDLGGDGIPGGIIQIGPTSEPNTNGLLAGATGTFTFNVSGFTPVEFTTVGVGVHAIGGPNGCSTKFAVWDGGNSTNDFGADGGPGYDANCVTTTTTVTPEPVTVLLLGTGLLAVAGVARRRRNDFEIDEA